MKGIAVSTLRSAGAVVGLAAAAIALTVGFYEVHDFRPALPRIEAIYANMDLEDRKPPDNVQAFVWKVDGRIVDGFASRALLSELHGPMRMSAWHYHAFMLELMLRWHLNREQRLALYCHYLPYEKGRGFTKAANFYFDKKPDALSLDQLATIVAVGRAPGMNSPSRHPENLEAAKRLLLSENGTVQ